ncbi:unnamed protein product [Brachionus calyciflorus]|uniref:CCHC-type domain-containing protein n=1 Tax=Brachionus calyciflorus TaxID=104777 RepID=A0A813W7H8_9BILA|nr:unnamed protein product [Brachionus calyciflorus]
MRKKKSSLPIKLDDLIVAGRLEDAVREQLQDYGQTNDKSCINNVKKHGNSNECPAAGKQCRCCGKSGHYAQLCKQKDGNGQSHDTRNSSGNSGTRYSSGGSNGRCAGNGTGRGSGGYNRGGGKNRKQVSIVEGEDDCQPVYGPTPWVSPIVPVQKPGKQNEIRICTDAREANKAILRSRHSCPTLGDLAVRLNGARFISKFDIRSGYNQILLRALNFSDDIIVFGATKEEHNQRLEDVLKRLEDSGLTVNETKCEFGKRRLKFFGLEFSEKVRSLLGLANHCDRFIPELALIVKPLRELVKKKTKWNWTEKHGEALQKLKKSICTDSLCYFDPKLRTDLALDASPVGLAAVMAQYYPRSQMKGVLLCLQAVHSLKLNSVILKWSVRR